MDGITKLLPDIDFFILMYLRKDATASSQIEGTSATMNDAIEAEIGISKDIPDDVNDILHYIKALNFGIKRLEQDNFPLSLRFIKELHEILMNDGRVSQHAYPGEFRKSQNWIGGKTPKDARFVPPPVSELQTSLSDLENFLHARDNNLVLLKAALVHAQFETIHPFNDGNGRTGRMLINFYLKNEKFLDKPVLFLSAYFQKHQSLYYEKLTCYREGKIEEWIEFFIEGIIEISNEAIVTVERITKLRDIDTLKIQALSKRASESAIVVLPKLYTQPIVTVMSVMEWTKFERNGAQKVIDRFVDLGILKLKDEDVKYGKTYVYKKYLDIFQK